MDVGQVVLVMLALVGVAALPAAIVLVVCADDLLDRFAGGRSPWRKRRHERRTVAPPDRTVEFDALPRDVGDPGGRDREPLERVAAELRRLRRHGVGRDGRPTLWPGNTIQAYDERLRAACRALGIAEHLAELAGMDREIERVRVEGELNAAGLTLPAATPDHHPRRQ